MILNTSTGLFKSSGTGLHSWELVNGDFYPTRGGGGGLRVISDCHFRKTATGYDSKPGIKWLSYTEK
jgi:hypothetical protein